MSHEDDEAPQLSAEAMAALADFRAEQIRKEEELISGDGKNAKIDEDWQLSQFWYDADTSRRLVEETIAVACQGRGASDEPAQVACVSSPTLVEFFHETEEYKTGRIKVKVFEYDQRFGLKFPDEFVPYDYNHPTALPEDVMGTFDVVVADPPFLAAECLIKTAHTIRLIGKQNVRILLCTGAIMEEYAQRLLSLHRTKFEPRHANNLANDFACFANYETITL